MTAAAPLVYSYTRFSTAEQRKGTGQARQDKLAADWCKARGLTLCRNYADLGVSAFKGRNVEHGALARFLRAVEDEKVAGGSTLLVENLDRLSRQNLNKAVELFLRIINSGIRVVTLSDDKEYTADRLELPELMMSLLIFARANDESRMKSQRKAASWRYKREAAQKHGTPIGGKSPLWLKVEDGKYVVIEREAERVRRIFADYVAGSGIYTLNKLYGVPKATLAWWLNNPAVIGTLRVTEEGRKLDLPKHYPAIINRATWDKAQRKKVQRFVVRRDGRTGYVNLFAGLLFDHRGRRFDVQRHYGFPSYVAHGLVLQADKLESVLVHFVIPGSLVTTAVVDLDEPDPHVARLDEKIEKLNQQLVDAPVDMMDSVLVALRRLKEQKREVRENGKPRLVRRVDRSVLDSLLEQGGTFQTRLAARELIRDSVTRIVVRSAAGSSHYRLVDCEVTLHDGHVIPFAFAYATRRLGYIVLRGFAELPDVLGDAAWRDPGVTPGEPIRRINTDRVTQELIRELMKFPLRRPEEHASRSGEPPSGADANPPSPSSGYRR